MEYLPDRPAVLTPEVQKKIIEAMALGSYLNVACLAAGTTKDVVYYWKRLYEAGVKHAQIYADFFNALERASAVAEVGALGGIRSGRPGWQGEAWFLERRFPSRWLMKRQKEITSNVPIVAELVGDAEARAAKVDDERSGRAGTPDEAAG